jgi:tripartite ATP-independent transporter DctM subunit
MSPELVTIAAAVLFVALILIEVPVAFALAVAGGAGIAVLAGPQVAFSAIASAPYTAVAKYDLLILPMFILLGAIVANAGIAERIFGAANRLVGWLPGGLGITTIAACTIFGGISGSSVADAATLGRVSIGEMRAHGYSARFSAGLVAASGMIAILIPPSIPLVVYGILTGVPIGSLLLAGIVPGLMTAALFAIYVAARAAVLRRRVGHAANGAAIETLVTPAASESGARRGSFSGIIYAGILFLVVVGGIYAGILTSTEAAAAGAFAALLIAIFVSFKDRVPLWPMLGRSMREAAETSAMIFALLVGSAIFTFLLAYAQVPTALASWAVSLSLPPWLIVVCFLAILIPLGMFLDGFSMLLLTVPVAYPIVHQFGVDGVWFGVLVVTMIELGLITPPVGINVYVVAGVVDDLTVEEVFIGVTPFILIQLLVTALIFLFPQIALFLPAMAVGA